MSDRELLELAAKSAGIDAEWHNLDDADYDAGHDGLWLKGARGPSNSAYWNPLTDDGDALRLAVKLGLKIEHHDDSVVVWDDYCGTGFIPYDGDACNATRHAIVRAAAEIERNKAGGA